MQHKTFNIQVTIGLGPGWPSGTPVKSEALSNGCMRHTIEDGRVFTVSVPNYRLEYRSSLVGAGPDDTYEVNIAPCGLSGRDGFFEAWNFDKGGLRNYAFDKTVKITNVETGEVFTGAELRECLENGQTEYLPPESLLKD